MADEARCHSVCTSDKALWNSLYIIARRPAAYISAVLHLDANVCELTKFSHPVNTIMADSNRIVFPDEVEEVKAKAVAEAAAEDKTSGGDTNTIEETPKMLDIKTRNMITVPTNCPPGFQMGADGVCREVFK